MEASHDVQLTVPFDPVSTSPSPQFLAHFVLFPSAYEVYPLAQVVQVVEVDDGHEAQPDT